MTTATHDVVVLDAKGYPIHQSVCSWCDRLLRVGVLPISHSICPACLERLEQEIA
jgi:hypothetical protein